MKDQNYPILIDNAPSDLSDSANHTIYWVIMRLILGDKIEDVRHLYFDYVTGLGKRHPTREIFSFTRDQSIPFMCLEALLSVRDEKPEGFEKSSQAVWRFFEIIKENNGIYYNVLGSDGIRLKKWWDRDFLDPQLRSVIARAKNEKRWMHYLGDLNLYATIRFKDAFRPYSEADENIHCLLLVSKFVRPTFITKWCWDYYFFKTKMNWKDKITGFFDRGGRYYPEIPPVAIAALEKLLENKK